MKKSFWHGLLFGGLLVACALFAHGQEFPPQTITGTGCTKPYSLSQRGTATYQIIGSWSGTIQPQISVAGQTPVNTQATPANSTTPQATITANGAYFTSVSGYSEFVLCGNSVTGTATIYVNLSTAPH
jgi:hypothetical protein